MNEYLAHGSVCYAATAGLEVAPVDWSAVRSDPRVGARIAAAYLAAPRFDPAALPAYRTLRDETMRQLDCLTRRLRVHVEVTAADPYTKASQLHADLRERRLRVWSTRAGDNPHPFFADDENDSFRAVHDAFGHGATGQGFDRHGEEAAWLKHSQMFTPLARRAMTTETRGQTCAFVYANGGRFFSSQKAVLLPEEFWS